MSLGLVVDILGELVNELGESAGPCVGGIL